MRNEFMSYEDIPYFSDRDKAYQRNDASLHPFAEYEFNYQSLDKVIADRKQFPVDRGLLIQELNNQYKDISHNEKVIKNINTLASEDSFTVITAHQPSLFTGPFYFILKICSAINLASRLSKSSGKKILPVFILGAEDHDFEEINHLMIFGKKVSWDREASGAVGRLNKDGLTEVIEKLSEILGTSVHAEELINHLAFAQKESSTYGEFMFKLVHSIFHQYGLIIANFDNISFKNRFRPLIKKEIVGQFSKELVTDTQRKLRENGYNDQAYSRDINFFYFNDNGRNRIEFKEEKYFILDTNIVFTKEEIEKEIDNHPERFSPNVIMRPLFQEMIMPNLAYIGGGGELAYWLERKSQFKAANVFYPMLIRRNSAVWVSKRVQKDLEKLDLEFKDLLQETELLLKEYAIDQSSHDLNFQSQIDALENIYSPLSKAAELIDPTLIGRIEAMRTQAVKDIDKIKTRLVRGVKQKQEVKLNKLKKVKEQVFPGNNLQERKVNFMEFYLTNGHSMIDYLIEVCNPFDKGFMVVYED